MNGKSVSVPVAVSDRADEVLEAVCAHIELPSDLTYYFALFLEKETDNTRELVTIATIVSLLWQPCSGVPCVRLSESTPHTPHSQH